MDLADERRFKHRRVVEFLDDHALDAVLLSRRCNFSWFTCGAHNHVAVACDAGNSVLLVARDSARVVANNIEAARLQAEELARTGIHLVVYDYHDPAAQDAAFETATRGLRLAADAPVPGATADPLSRDFDRLRWTFTPGEIERYRAVCSDVVRAVETVARAAEPGQSENHLAGRLAAELRDRDLVPWVLLVGADHRIEQFRHPLPTPARLQRYVMLVTCAERGGLIAACTRLAHFGSPPEALEARHRAVATVDTALIQATRPGTTLGQLFDEARAAYEAVGHPDEWRRHHQGGSCGYLPREVKAAPGLDLPALENQPFAWNPSITGTKAEDTILCSAQGPVLLAEPTPWPTVRAEWKGAAMDRPAILVR